MDAWLEAYSGGLSAGVIHTTRVNASYPKEWDSEPYVLAPGAPDALKAGREAPTHEQLTSTHQLHGHSIGEVHHGSLRAFLDRRACRAPGALGTQGGS